MLKKVFSILFIIFVVNSTLPAKDTLRNYRGSNDHAGDIAKLLTGSDYVTYSENPNLNVLEEGLAYIMHLVVDSRMKKDGEPFPDTEEAMQYLQEHQKELKISGIPNLKEFIT